MTHHEVLTLLGISGVAATFAGFTGVVAAFGRRAERAWLPEERFRLANLLLLSLGACFLAFLPIVIDSLGLAPSHLWHVAGPVLAIFCAAYAIYVEPRRREVVRSRRSALHPGAVLVIRGCVLGAFSLQLLGVSGVLGARGSGAYVTGLVLLLVPAAIQFTYLVLSSPPSDDAKRGERDVSIAGARRDEEGV